MTKLASVIIVIAIIAFGVFLSFSILVYSLKEQDNAGFYGMILSFGLIFLGFYTIKKAQKIS
jgi:hypothetical protein